MTSKIDPLIANTQYRNASIVVSFRSSVWTIVGNRDFSFWYNLQEEWFHHGNGIFNATSAGWKSIAIQTKFSRQSPLHKNQT